MLLGTMQPIDCIVPNDSIHVSCITQNNTTYKIKKPLKSFPPFHIYRFYFISSSPLPTWALHHFVAISPSKLSFISSSLPSFAFFASFSSSKTAAPSFFFTLHRCQYATTFPSTNQGKHYISLNFISLVVILWLC